MSEKSNIMATAKARYEALLEASVATPVFYTKMVSLVSEYPYYFGPYLEMIDYLEARKLPLERQELIHATLKRIRKLLTTPVFLEEIRKTWTKQDSQILLNILARAGITYFTNPLLMRQVRRLLANLPSEPISPLKHLIPIKTGIAVDAIQEEIAANEIAWSYDTARQDTVSHHQHTNAIALRILENRGEAFTAVDGRHESKRTPLAPLFPKTTKFFEEFSDEMRGGLGRVALVRLKPHSTVYRHYDDEPWLKGRNRYHLVIKSAQGSYMTSGNEVNVFREGDLFQFDNKVMHTAENRSPGWRIHAIFDMKVPEK